MSPRIVWRQLAALPPPETRGHGVQFLERGELIGWLDGFSWLHGAPDEVVIVTIRSLPIDVMDRIETDIRRRRVMDIDLGSGIEAYVNG